MNNHSSFKPLTILRETYGAVLYLDGRYDAAVEVFKEHQRRRPNNSRSLFGLWKTLEAQRSSEAGNAKESFNKQWKSDKLGHEQGHGHGRGYGRGRGRGYGRGGEQELSPGA
jgi:hypothetical protein